jgi:hypothetical protein
MEQEPDSLNIKKNFLALALVIVAVLLVIDVVLRVNPAALRPDVRSGAGTISAVGHHREFDNGASYYIYTIFESNGDVYQCWWDETRWNQKKVTNYKGPTLVETE